MKNMHFTLAMCVYVFTCVNCAFAQDSATIIRKIADAYGVSSFSAVSKIKFTFHVVRDTVRVSRSWLWEPKSNRVTLENQPKQDKPVSYVRPNPGDSVSAEIRTVDWMFVNDQYWLIFPFHLVWDSMATVEVKERQTLPIGSGNATQVTVSYPKRGGYTPGDAYELFIDKNYRILQWRYMRGGEKQMALAEWKKNASAGAVKFSLDRPGVNGFRVWFTNVAVVFDNSDNWISAH
jgi:hypothetical protein